jgi:glyoxylase-like metal-dependent hydrolase (beta-lactamase superfamily II)
MGLLRKDENPGQEMDSHLDDHSCSSGREPIEVIDGFDRQSAPLLMPRPPPFCTTTSRFLEASSPRAREVVSTDHLSKQEHNMNRREFFALTTAAAVSVTQGISAATAAAPIVRTQAPGFYRMDLNGTEITALLDGTIAVPFAQIYGNITQEQVNRQLDAVFLKSPVETSVNAYLVNTGERLVLIDAGTGSLLGDTLGKLQSALGAAGYRPEQIDTVILTHIHSDHSGGLVSNGRIVFPNATVHINQREFDFWLGKDQLSRAPESLKKYFQEAAATIGPYHAVGRVKTFPDNADPLPGFSSIWLPGHTPGHSAVVVQRGGTKIAFWGDITHGDVIQFNDSNVTIEFDVDPAQAAETRAKAFADAASGRYWVAGAHIAFPGIGHVRADNVGYDWVPLNFSTKGMLGTDN